MVGFRARSSVQRVPEPRYLRASCQSVRQGSIEAEKQGGREKRKALNAETLRKAKARPRSEEKFGTQRSCLEDDGERQDTGGSQTRPYELSARLGWCNDELIGVVA
jgi:hypothetical protein